MSIHSLPVPASILVILLIGVAAGAPFKGTATAEEEKAPDTPTLDQVKADGTLRSSYRNSIAPVKTHEAPKANLKGFRAEIEPVLAETCVECHGPDKQKGKFRVDTLDPDLVRGEDVSWWLEVMDVLSNDEMPPEEIKFGKDGAYTLMPGYYLRVGESDGSESYAPADGPDAGSVKKAAGAITLQGSFLLSKDGKVIGLITNFYQAVNAKAKGITRTTRPSLLNDSIQRALVYGGRVGNKIKLGYREIWMNIRRPSEIQFIEHDLTESNMVESNGARIEALKATEDFIRYRIMKSFSSAK